MVTISETLGRKVREFRESQGLSQTQVAHALKLSRPSVSQIESGQRRTSADELLKLSELLNVSVQILLDLEKQPTVALQKGKRVIQESHSVRINVPQKNVEKFRQILLYILNQVGSKPNVGETVIYKLLYFIDFDFYEKYEEQCIGATYQKNHHGPTPVEFKKVVEDMIAKEEVVRVKSKFFSYPQTKYLPLKRPDLTMLKAHEKEIIDDVLCRLSDMNASQISEYSHDDVPWIVTEEGAFIKYESAFYRTAQYSVREYSEDL